MSEITIHFHPKLAEEIFAEGASGARAFAALSRHAIRIVQVCGPRIAYAPVILPNGGGCAMSARRNQRGLILEIDQPGTIIPGRGVVREKEREQKPPLKQRR